MYDYFIFDFDGTLSDTYPVFTKAFLQVAEKYGVAADYQTAYDLLKISTKAVLEHYHYFGLPAAQAREEFEEIYCQIAQDTQQLFPEARPLLQYAVEKGKKCYIYTHSGQWVYGLLDRMQIREYVDFVLDCTYPFPRKPAPDGLNFICEKCNIDKSRALMIGDRDIDVLVGHNAGMASCLFDSDNYYPDCQAEHKIVSLNELKELMK